MSVSWFGDLASRARRGDAAARELFRDEIEPRMEFIVRHHLRPGSPPSAVGDRVRQVAQELNWSAGRSPEEKDWIIRRIARRLSEAMAGGLAAGPDGTRHLRETVRC